MADIKINFQSIGVDKISTAISTISKTWHEAERAIKEYAAANNITVEQARQAEGDFGAIDNAVKELYRTLSISDDAASAFVQQLFELKENTAASSVSTGKFFEALQDLSNELTDSAESAEYFAQKQQITIEEARQLDTVLVGVETGLETFAETLGISTREAQQFLEVLDTVSTPVTQLSGAANSATTSVNQLQDTLGISGPVNEFQEAVSKANQEIEQFARQSGLTIDQAKALGIASDGTAEAVAELATKLDITVEQAERFAKALNIQSASAAEVEIAELSASIETLKTGLRTAESEAIEAADSLSVTSQQATALGFGVKTAEKSIQEFATTLGISEAEARKFVSSLGELPSVQKASQVEAERLQSAVSALQEQLTRSDTAARQLGEELGITQDQAKSLGAGVDIADQAIKEFARTLNITDKDAQQFADALRDIEEVDIGDRMEGQEVLVERLQTAMEGLTTVSQSLVESFINYDRELSKIAVRAGENIDVLSPLSDEVLRLSSSTGQSTESILAAANAFIGLGMTATEARENLEPVVTLSGALSAWGVTAEEAAAVVNSSLQVFSDLGLTAEQVSDKLTALFNISNVEGFLEIESLFNSVGAVASDLGVNLDELLASYGQLRDLGQTSEQAVAGLEKLLLGLSQNKDALGDLGVSAFDANGKLISLSAVYDQLAAAGIDLTAATELSGSGFNLLGQEGVNAALLLSNSSSEIADATDALANSTGATAEQFGKVTESAAKKLEIFNASFEVLKIEAGAALVEGLLPIVGMLKSLVDGFNELNPVFQRAIVGAGAFTFALTALSLVIVGVQQVIDALTISTVAKGVASAAAAIKTELLTAAESKGIIVKKANAVATAQGTFALNAYTVSVQGAIVATSTLVAGIAALAAIFVGIEISKTVNELKELNTEVEALGNGAAAQVDSVNKVSIGLRDVTAEINALRKEGLDVSDELLKKQQQYILLGRQSLDEIQLEIDLRKQLIAAIEAGNKGQLDGFGLGKLNKGQQEALLNSLKLQVAELSIANGVLERQIVAAGGVKEEAKGIADELENATSAAEKLETALAGAETEANRKRIAAYEDFVGDAEGLEKRLSEVNIEELQARLTAQQAYFSALKAEKQISNEDILKADREVRAAERALANEVNEENRADLEQQLADKQNYLAKLKTDKEASKDELLKAEEDLVSAELTLTQAKADQQKEIEQESAKIREEAEAEFLERQKERIETEKALRQAAYDEEVRQIEDLKNQAELAAQARIDAQNAVLESLDDQSDAIKNQITLLGLQAERQDILAARRMSQFDNEVESLQTAKELLQRLNDSETSINEKRAIREKLQREGIGLTTTEAEINEAIRQKESDRRDEEFRALLRKQEQEQISLTLSQEQERIDLRRQLAQAEIAKIEAEALVVQTLLTIKAQERLIAFKELELVAKRAEGASQSELISLQGQIEAEKANLELKQAELPLAERSLDIANQQIADIQDAQTELEGIFKAQQSNLKLQQDVAREQARQLDRREDESDRFERAQEGITANDIQRGRALARSTGSTPREVIPGGQKSVPIAQQMDVSSFKLVDALDTLTQTILSENEAIRGVQLRANGGLVNAGQPYIVGERRPELFVPRVPGTIVPRVPQIMGGMGDLSKIESLLTQLAMRPAPTLNAPATFINQPNPLQTQIELLQGQLRASRGVF